MLVRLTTASLNHRDLFQRRGLYPGTAPSIPLLADGAGTVLTASSPLHGKLAIICPIRGWVSAASGPETAAIAILGGTKHYTNGTLQEFAVFDEADVVAAPPHLSPEEAAALPLCGLTAWRAVISKGKIAPGENVLITGIGGGVALMALLFCVGRGARVFVTSSSQDKIERAMALGAAGGVSYRSKTWEKDLAALLPGDRKYLDAVVDGAGGDVIPRVTRIMRDGGRVVVYGMTTGPSMPLPMGAVLKNIEVLGSTMGSRKEFSEMLEFVSEKQLRPVVDRVYDGLDIEELEKMWGRMEEGGQFGKLVVRIRQDGEGASKL